jgi:hypothetical protein
MKEVVIVTVLVPGFGPVLVMEQRPVEGRPTKERWQ